MTRGFNARAFLIPAVICAGVLAFAPMGLALIAALGLALLASVNFRINRYSDTNRWLCTGIGVGGLLGMLLALARNS